jgi:hypothetical protein
VEQILLQIVVDEEHLVFSNLSEVLTSEIADVVAEEFRFFLMHLADGIGA